MHQNLWNAAKTVLKEKKRSKINNLNFYLKNLEKKQIKPKVWEIKITAEINENRKWANREN